MFGVGSPSKFGIVLKERSPAQAQVEVTKAGAKPSHRHGRTSHTSSPLKALKKKSVSVLSAYFSARGVEAKAEIREARKREDRDIRRQLAHHALGGDVVQVETLLKHTGRSVDTRMEGDVAEVGEEDLTVCE